MNVAEAISGTIAATMVQVGPEKWRSGEDHLVSIKIPKEVSDLFDVLEPTMKNRATFESEVFNGLIRRGLRVVEMEVNLHKEDYMARVDYFLNLMGGKEE